MNRVDFNTLMAIGIHDMKGSLNAVINTISDLVDPDTGECRCERERLIHLQYEAQRVNDTLVQLLTLYRRNEGFYTPQFAPTPVYDLLEEQALRQKPLMDYRGVVCEIDCDEDLIWPLDAELMGGLLENVITNTICYTVGHILLSATRDADWLRIGIEDDGPGFPEAMLGRRDADQQGVLDRSAGRTGLGLYFCAVVAQLHGNPPAGGGDDDSRLYDLSHTGFVELRNNGALGGGAFVVNLPRILPSSG
ncbi:sensor histidine kinase KdpD [Thioalkalivibrio sp. ALE28]|uniref:sensor histidine kinase n=1 Tax=Thioalkalivibrio sp. ALE28 TaxID=1158179 RepID=UPI0003AAAC3A|nr:HAMP domain-containing sensor histidine kinase [Thioalkalivibrio sp. ALE28]